VEVTKNPHEKAAMDSCSMDGFGQLFEVGQGDEKEKEKLPLAVSSNNRRFTVARGF
jgi:hypothetical protein